MELIFSGIAVGVALSLIFIGPVFFLLLETSINKGWKQAIILDLGVIACDLLFIFIFYFSLKDFTELIEDNPIIEKSMFRIGGLLLLIYGLIMVFKKENFKSMRKKKMKEFNSNYFATFMNGFLLNLLNVGVIFFWFTTVSYLSVTYTKTEDFIAFIMIAFATFFGIDLLKIVLAQRVKKLLSVRNTIALRRFMGGILIVFSLLLFVKSFGVFDAIDDKVEEQFHKRIEN